MLCPTLATATKASQLIFRFPIEIYPFIPLFQLPDVVVYAQ